ncbi:hypothetical protein ACFQZ1_25500 [Bacillus sp. CGMCC 1.60114]
MLEIFTEFNVGELLSSALTAVVPINPNLLNPITPAKATPASYIPHFQISFFKFFSAYNHNVHLYAKNVNILQF